MFSISRSRSVALALLASISLSCTESTAPASVGTVTVTASSTSLASGATLQLVAAVLDNNGGLLANRPITWASSNESTATVSVSGFVTAGRVLAESDQAVTIAATSGGVSGTVTLFVRPVPVATVVVSPATASIAVGATQQLTAIARDAGSVELLGRTVTWVSSDTTVARVSAAGLVTPVAYAGAATRTATITTTSEGQSGAAALTVTPAPVATVVVSPATATLLAVGATQQLAVEPRSSTGVSLTGRTVGWSSESPTVATVSELGVVTAVGTGSAEIRAMIEGVVGTATVTVETFPSLGLRAFLTFDGNTADSSGNGNDFANAGGVFVPDRNGRASSAISFATMSAGASRTWSDFPRDSFTVALWLRIEGQALSVGYHFFLWGSPPGEPQPGIRISLDENWVARSCGASSSGYAIVTRVVSSDAALVDGTGCLSYSSVSTWRHVVISSAGGTVSAYINGQLDRAFVHATPVTFSSTMAYLGVNSNASNTTARIIDSFGVWGRSLSAAEVLALYVSGR